VALHNYLYSMVFCHYIINIVRFINSVWKFDEFAILVELDKDVHNNYFKKCVNDTESRNGN
jgi:hypothetical protein